MEESRCPMFWKEWDDLRIFVIVYVVFAGERKKLLSDLFRRPSSRLTLLDNQRGVLYINQSQSSPSSADASKTSTPTLEVRTKNAVYCAIVLREFLKELAAISQEHLLVHAESSSVIAVWLFTCQSYNLYFVNEITAIYHYSCVHLMHRHITWILWVLSPPQLKKNMTCPWSLRPLTCH